jgi:hypothetical protein
MAKRGTNQRRIADIEGFSFRSPQAIVFKRFFNHTNNLPECYVVGAMPQASPKGKFDHVRAQNGKSDVSSIIF